MSFWYDYALIRVVPRVERGECANVGVLLFCREADYLGVRVQPNWEAIRVLGPELDRELVTRALEALVRVVEGAADGGPMAALPKPDRFHWLTAPRSTVIQPSAVHTGRCDDPEAELEALFEALVM